MARQENRYVCLTEHSQRAIEGHDAGSVTGDSPIHPPVYVFLDYVHEFTGASNNEQLVIFIRWIINTDFEVHDIGLYAISDITATTIVIVIKNAHVRLNLGPSKCCGQCYDGASNISGPSSGVAKQLRVEEPRHSTCIVMVMH